MKGRKVMRRLVALLIVLAMVLLPACGQEDRWQEQYELGRKYLSDGDYEEAILAFTLAIEIDPEQPKAYLYRGDAYIMAALECMEDGDYDEAEDFLDMADDDYDRAEDLDYDEDKIDDRREELEELEDELRQQEKTDVESSVDAPQEEAQPEPVMITVSDAYVDTIEDPDYGDIYCYHIPRFDMDGDAAAEMNEKIYQDMMTVLEEQVYAWDYPGLGIMTYTWGQTEQLASVLIFTNPVYYHFPECYTYTIDTRTGKEMTFMEILAVYGYDESSFQAKVREVLDQYYEDWRVELQEGAYGDSFDFDFFDGQKEKALSDDNLLRAVPYVDENGNLCVVIPVYGIAGADYYYSRINLEGGASEVTSRYLQCQIHGSDGNY